MAPPTTLFVVTRTHTYAQTLMPVDSLAKDVTDFGELLEAGASGRALAGVLGKRLLDPAIARLPAGVTHLVIVPDGILHRVPFDALIVLDSVIAATRYSISIAPAASVAVTLWSQARRPLGGRVLALGDPRFEGERTFPRGSAAETYREVFDAQGGLTRLPASAAEARAVARFSARSVVRLRSAASEAFLKGTAPDSFAVLHFATHAVVDEKSPARSALALAPGEGEDGFLGTEELASLALHGQLVVLSACRTARGTVIGGEGVQGLAASLMQAGARAVVASLWRVEDHRTVPFVERLYGGMARGLTVGDALREARLDAMRRGESPAVWAAFTVIGDAGVTVALVRPRLQWTTVAPLLVLVLVAAAAYGAWIRKRRGPARTSPPSTRRATTLQ